MTCIVHRTVRDRLYRYLVESYRNQEGKLQQKDKCFGSVPKLPDDAPIGVVLFAGGGGVEAGMVMAGIRPVISVEYDPGKPDLSRALAQSNHMNFKPYGGRVIKRSVQACAASNFSNFPRNPDYLHASPVCSNFSAMKSNKGETQTDESSALATAQAIKILQPVCFTLENVPAYRDSKSWNLIEATLKAQGYKIIAAVLDGADYGVPQSRKRFIVKAVRDGIPTLPPKLEQIGWYKAIAKRIPELPDSELLLAQQKALQAKLEVKPNLQALLIERIGYRNQPQIREPAEPVWTLKRSIFTDQNQNNRNRFIDIWLADGTVKALNIEASARLQSFPRWYVLPEEISVAGSIVGYSVPPVMMQKLLQG